MKSITIIPAEQVRPAATSLGDATSALDLSAIIVAHLRTIGAASKTATGAVRAALDAYQISALQLVIELARQRLGGAP